MADKYERRAIQATLTLEKRGRDIPTIVGHAAVFDQVTDLGYMKERVAPGAFARTLAEGGPVYALWNHDPSYIVASTKNGTLRLSEDKIGLRAEMDPMDTPTIRDLVVKPIQDGVVDKMSFGFSVEKDEMRDGVRVLRDVNLFDVSPVTFPAYPGTDISARAAAMRRLMERADPSMTEMLQQMCDLMDQLMEKMGVSDGDADEPMRGLQKAQESGLVDAKTAGAVLAAARERELTLNFKKKGLPLHA